MHKSCYCCGVTPSHAMNVYQDAECYKCNCKSKKREKDMGKLKDMRKIKSEKSMMECTNNSRTMDAAAVCISICANSILQPLSSE